jgi:soluble lytic murein transglycosylase-like protein
LRGGSLRPSWLTPLAVHSDIADMPRLLHRCARHRARALIAVAGLALSVCLADSRPAGAYSAWQRVNNEVAMKAYVAAIRYFNPGIDDAEARQIVAAIVRESMAQGVDPRLVVAIVATESAFDRTARSPAGARGLGQLMPETAAEDGVSDVEDINQNIHGTVMTLKGDLEHYARFDPQHQYVYAIAAYNAGTGAVDRYGGVPPYDETIRYVWKVIVLWRRFYGLSAS